MSRFSFGRRVAEARVKFVEDFRLAFGTLRANKLRSFLTILGTLIGVCSIIALVSIINGLNRYVAKEIAEEGSATFWVDRFGIITNAEEWMRAMKRRPFDAHDYRSLVEGSTTASEVTARRWRQEGVKFRSHRLERIGILGVTGGYEDTHSLAIAEGRHFLREEADRRQAVVVIGYQVRDEFLGALDPVGKELRIGGRTFDVVGSLAKRGSMLGESQDDLVLIPLSVFEKSFGRSDNLHFVVRAADSSPEGMETAQEEVRAIMRMSRGLAPGEPDDFDIVDSKMLMDLYRSFTGGFFIVMIGIVSVSLVVGGIVIMNIMLVSVTERTREIGIRKAIGARRSDVMRQFLVESALLSVAGGAIGVALGAGLATLIRVTSGMPVQVEWWSVAAGLGLACSVGITFGLYPAARASRLEPIAALRYE
jgi:putative ABC transport system permease protein